MWSLNIVLCLCGVRWRRRGTLNDGGNAVWWMVWEEGAGQKQIHVNVESQEIGF